jgi:hypothetical protein
MAIYIFGGSRIQKDSMNDKIEVAFQQLMDNFDNLVELFMFLALV